MKMFLLAALFFVLSPGVLLTIPAGSKGIWMSGQTSVAAAIVHALVFVIVLHFFGRQLRMLEGFACNSTTQKTCSVTKNGRSTTYCVAKTARC